MEGAFVSALSRAVPEPVRAISRTLRQAGHPSWLVGGSVRDVLLAVERGQTPTLRGDWDLASSARPEQVQKLFKKVLPTGIQHGTVTIVLGGQHYELTTLRGEKGHSDGRRPDEVFFVDDLREDLARRDFTVNAIAFSVEDETLHDPFDGVADLRRGLLRAVGEPLLRFSEDGLRVLRGARFCATLGMMLDEGTRQAMRPSLESFRKVSLERVRDEWLKALTAREPSRCFRVQASEGLLGIVAPRLFESTPEAEFEAALAAVDSARPSALLRLAVLCTVGFSGANAERASSSGALAAHLRLPNAEKARLQGLVAAREIPTDAAGPSVRRWLSSVGRSAAPETLEYLSALPASARASDTRLGEFLEAARAELATNTALSLAELELSGKDLLASRLLAPGPEVGRVLQRLLDGVLDDPTLNDRASLLALATELCRV